MIYRHLHHAGLIISGDFYKPRIDQMTKDIEQVVNQFITQSSDILNNVLDETEGNLYSIAKEDRESYLTGILKDFIDIAPYLNYSTDKKYGKEFGKRAVKIGDKTLPGCINDCHKLIIRYELKHTKHLDDLSNPEKYIILCFHIYRNFFNNLNSICLNFDIDIIEVQYKNGLQIWQKDNMHSIKKSEGKSNETDVLTQQKEHEFKNEKSTDTIHDKVFIAFEWMQVNDSRKHKLILNENDFEKLIDYVTYYFDNNFSLPKIDQPIKKINTAKGNVVYTFMKFFKDEYPSHTRPDSLFELIKKVSMNIEMIRLRTSKR